MIKLAFRILAALIVGFIFGWMFGMIIGTFIGFCLSFFFLEIVKADQTTLASIFISVASGGILGFVLINVLRKMFDTSDKPLTGVLIGGLTGFIVLYFYGVIANPYPNNMYAETLYLIPIMYGVSISGQVGGIIYPAFSVVAVIREAINSYSELKMNKKLEYEKSNELSFYRSSKNDSEK